MRRSCARSSSSCAISAAGTSASASSSPIRARRPIAIDALSESTMWISRSGSMSRAIRALLMAPDNVSATWTATIASAPSADAPSEASRNSAGDEAAVVGNGASGAVIRAQNSVPSISTPARNDVSPKLTISGMTWMPDAAASAGSRSDAESVKIATRAPCGTPPPDHRWAGRCGASYEPRPAVPLRFRRMDRSLRAVLAGTFTLRFSTGLTGAMLAIYLAQLPQHGGEAGTATTLALLHAMFYVAELVLSPFFGILSDRLGHHRVMLFGRAFGAAAVILTGLTTNLIILGGTRWLAGASTAASVPSILGFIAIATAADELLRGKMSARFEGATLLGLGAGVAIGPI